jgi:hypothetical protein
MPNCSRFKSEDEELRRRTRSIREAIEKIENDLAALQGDIKGLESAARCRPGPPSSLSARSATLLWLGIRRHFMPTPAKPCRRAAAVGRTLRTRRHRADDAADGLFRRCRTSHPLRRVSCPRIPDAERTRSGKGRGVGRQGPGRSRSALGRPARGAQPAAPENQPKPRHGPPGGRPSCRSSMPVRRSGRRHSSAASLPRTSVAGSAKSMA